MGHARSKSRTAAGHPRKTLGPKPLQMLPWPRAASDDPAIQVGVDIARMKSDIERLSKNYFRQAGIPKTQPMEDILQEIFLAIHRKNRCRSAYDPRKSSFSHYVWIVCSNICCKIVQKSRALCRIPDVLQDSLDGELSEGDSRTLQDLLAESRTYESDADDRMDLLERKRVVAGIVKKYMREKPRALPIRDLTREMERSDLEDIDDRIDHLRRTLSSV